MAPAPLLDRIGLDAYVHPQDVTSPKDRVMSVPVVIFDGRAGGMSCATMDYNHDADPAKFEKDAVGIRWNGTEDSLSGFPSTHQYSTWFIVDVDMKDSVLTHFKARAAGTDLRLAFIGFLTTEHLTAELAARGYKVNLSR